MLAPYKSAMVAIIGKPNVGKSTLVNQLLGYKVSITSRRPQTTRRRVMAVVNKPQLQLAFFDTPGIHQSYTRTINSVMNKQANQSLDFADIVLWMINAGQLKDEDMYISKLLNKSVPTFLIINKIDRISPKQRLLPLLAEIDRASQHLNLAELIPLSAKTGKNTDRLLELLRNYAPNEQPLFSTDVTSDQSEPFFLAELVREKIIRLCGMEVPHQLGVTIEHMEDTKKCMRIDVTIYVEQQGQKRIVIGTKGSKLKTVGIQARQDMERLLGKKVMLSLWVKVKSNWSNDIRLINELGYAGYNLSNK